MSRSAWERRAPDAYWRKGDTSPAITEQLLDGTGAVVDLTSATAQFLGTFPDAASSGQQITGTAAIVGAPTNGTLRYTPVAADTDTPGDLLVRWKVTFSGGAIETFPNWRNQKVRVVA